jgi:hypothetical protein
MHSGTVLLAAMHSVKLTVIMTGAGAGAVVELLQVLLLLLLLLLLLAPVVLLPPSWLQPSVATIGSSEALVSGCCAAAV